MERLGPDRAQTDGPPTLASMLILDLAAEHVPATLLRQQRLATLVEDRILDVDLEQGVARFGDDLSFDLQVVGSVVDAQHTFTWAWATGGDPRLVTAVAALRDYGQTHEVEELTEATWHTEDVDPFLLAAIARGWCQADAMYRAPTPGGAVYLLLGDVELPPPTAAQVVQALTTGVALAPMDHRAAAISLFGDNAFSVTGMDDMVVVSVGKQLVNVIYAQDGSIVDVNITNI